MKRIGILLLTGVALLVAAPAEEKIVGGPYAVNVKGRSATIAWVVEGQQVRIGETPDSLTKSAPALYSRKVSFTGLAAGKTVYYDVLDGRAEGKGSFKTPPAGPATFEAVVFGDTRTRHDLHRRVIEAINRYATPELLIHTGDLVSDGSDSGMWPLFFDIERDLLRKTAFFPVLGNHEHGASKYYDFFEVTTPYYSFDWGQAHFVILNSDIGNVAISREARENFWEEQRRWMEEDLAASQKAQFRFAVMHHPPFTAVKRRQAGGGNTFVRALIPLFERYKVQAVFNGHDHNYQHHEFEGVHYVVTGGGGAPLYPVDGPMEGITKKVVSTEHFVRLKMEPGKASVEAWGLDGAILDTFEMKP